jgi:AbrB family looped-hinge helix DNA binding protein
MTAAATLTSKGQTTIPKEIRDSLGMKPGDRMTFTLMLGIDTNVLVRLLVRDDEAQFERARRLPHRRAQPQAGMPGHGDVRCEGGQAPRVRGLVTQERRRGSAPR